MANYRLIQRQDTEANWAAVVPAEGEFAYVSTLANAGRYKIGDGTDDYSTLPYAAPVTPNPAGGQENFLPIDGPTATGTATCPTLAVTSEAGLTVADPAVVPLTISGIAEQAGDLLSIVDSEATALVTVAADGKTTMTQTLTVGAAAHPDVTVDSTTFVAFNTASDYVRIQSDEVGGTSACIDVQDGGVALFSVRGQGRVTKTGTASAGDDLLDLTELDARYILLSDVWRPNIDPTRPIGYTQAFHGSGGLNVDVGSGTHLIVYFTWTTSSNIQTLNSSGVTTGTGTVALVDFGASFFQAFSFKIAE